MNRTDEKLLSYLYSAGRQSIAQIAKNTKLTRQQVDYRLKKYQEEEIIIKFATVFNWTAFGYNYHVILLLHTKKPNFERTSNAISILKAQNNQFLLNLIFREEQEFQSWLTKEILPKNEVLNYEIIKPYFSELYPLKLFNKKDVQPFTLSKPTKISFDKKDLQLLKILEKNHRTRLIDIARQLKISSELTLHKIKRLKNVVLTSRVQYNFNKIGFYYTFIQLNIPNLTEKLQNTIKQCARQHKLINSLLFTLNKPNCHIQIVHKTHKELRETINEITSLTNPLSINLLFLEEEEPINTLPFID